MNWNFTKLEVATYMFFAFFTGAGLMGLYYSLHEGVQCYIQMKEPVFHCEGPRMGTTSVERTGKVWALPEVTITLQD
jgi:hypothetical protein